MEKPYYYWLHHAPGIGKVTLKKLLEVASPREIYENSSEKIEQVLKPSQRENLKNHRSNWNLQKQWEELEKRKITFSYYGDKQYPGKLMNIPDPPLFLYMKGNKDCLHKPAVAVIGARECSAYGKCMAKELGKELAAMGIVVVSGMARGIDGICQWEALEQGGASIGVLGSGIEICYPKENQRLYDRLKTEGCLVSENPPFMAPKAGLFPLRNRIISGLADVIVVVEAREKSGTLITVDMALEQGKEVYAVPGRLTENLSRGCNRLIKQGAGVVLSAKELVEEICPLLHLKYHEKEEIVPKAVLSEEERLLYELITVDPKSLEEIWGLAADKGESFTLPQTIDILLQLCMKKLVMVKDKYYYRMI